MPFKPEAKRVAWSARQLILGWAASMLILALTAPAAVFAEDGHDRTTLTHQVAQLTLPRGRPPIVEQPLRAQLAIATPSRLAPGTAGLAYRQDLVVVGGRAPFQFVVESGALPGGLRLRGPVVSGKPAAAGDFVFTIKVTDNDGRTAAKRFSLRIQPPPIRVRPLTITTPRVLPPGTAGVLYGQAIEVSGGLAPFVFELTDGELPQGLKRNGPLLQGKPGEAGVFAFTIRVRDKNGSAAAKEFSLTIRPGLSITLPDALPPGIAGVKYDQELTAAGGTKPYVFTLAGGSLPAGIKVSGAKLLGLPGEAGTWTFSIKVTDGDHSTVTKSLSLTITPELTLTTPSQLPDGAVGAPYSHELTASGGAEPYSFFALGGSYPSGLTFEGAAFGGTPTQPGTWTMKVGVVDATQAERQKVVSLTVNPAPAITTPSHLPDAGTGTAYSQTFIATGGKEPYKFSLAAGGAWPPGLSLSDATLSGTPTAGGNYWFTVKVTGDDGGNSLRQFSMTVYPAPVITTPSPLPDAMVGINYNAWLNATGGKWPYTFELKSGELPAGIELKGSLTGSPTASGQWDFVIAATDAVGSPAEKAFALTVQPAPPPPPEPLKITTTSPLPKGEVSVFYSVTFEASGGTPPYTASIKWGSPPAGLAMDDGTTLSGTPSSDYAPYFGVTMTDTLGMKAWADFKIDLLGKLEFDLWPPSQVVLGKPLLITLQGHGGCPPYAFSIVDQAPPQGLTLTDATPSGATLTIIPTTAGPWTFTIKLTDCLGGRATETPSLVVWSPTSPLPPTVDVPELKLIGPGSPPPYP